MTQDEIIEMAKQAGLTSVDKKSQYLRDCLERFVKLVAAKAIAELESQKPMATIAVRWHEPVGKVAYVLEVNLPVGVHKLYTHPPQRTEQEPMADDFFKAIADSNPKPFPPTQRTWVGLTEEDMPDGENPMFDHKYFIAGMVFATKILKEKNT
jgi:hypothetical protein